MTHAEGLAAGLPSELAFPRSAKYGDDLALDASMGPNPLWLTEWLCAEMPLESGTRVLDLGCGQGLPVCSLPASTT